MSEEAAILRVPFIGLIVAYCLSASDCERINQRRADARDHIDEHRANANGVQIHVGNSVAEGDVYPMLITRVWGDGPDALVNGQVMLDGNDVLWTTSVKVGEGPQTWAWSTF